MVLSFQSDIDSYGIDPDGPAPAEEWDGPVREENIPVVEVPPTSFPLGNSEWLELTATINPTRSSEYNGVDIYIETVQFIEERIQ